uniref:Reverse transcriptase domain-containing protein n=1 Tax=Tanacetum cinerariifolium TaxID=118510 RepID=A0A6L2LA00_TANCI|nr:reverse transcriptase domain-containing protein [Tanacetum cinerariifolium]
MRTRSSSNPPVVSPSNPSTSNPKCRNRKRSKQPFILKESPIDKMADQRTMAELLRAPTERYAEAIVVPPIPAEQFELKNSLINMMTSDQFFRLEKDNPHDHIRWFNKITSTIKYKDFDESFHEAWDRYKDLLRAFPHHGFTELHQLDTFYNALNPADQDSLNAAAGGNLLERRTQDVLTIIKNKSKVRNSRNKVVVSQVKSCDANSNSSSEIAKLTHAVNQQTSVVTTAMMAILKQFQETPPPASVKAIKEICVTCGGAHPYYQCLAAGGNTFLELRDNIQGYVSAAAVNYNQGNSVYHLLAMQTQINMVKNELRNEMKNSIQASTSGSGSLPSNTVAYSKGELKAITTRSGLVLDGPIIPTLLPFINLEEDERVEKTLTDPNLSEYTIKAPPPPPIYSDWKKLSLPELISTRMTLELANRAIYTPTGIARDIFVLVGKFTFPADFVIVDYESDLGVPLILGRPFLRTARALIDVHGEEMILRDGDERLTLNMRHDTSNYSNQPQKESINLINVFNNSSEDFLEDLFSNQPSSNPTFSSYLELTSPEVQDDIFDLEGGNVLPERLLDLDSTKDLHPPLHYLANLADNFVDSMPEMFTDEHALDYSSPSIFDEYDDDFLEVESDTENVHDDPFDSKGEKIKASKLLIDELDLPYDFLPPSEYDSFISQDFSRVDVKPPNEDKIFNPGVLIQEKPFEIITHVVQDKKLATSNASLVLEDFDPPIYEPLFFKEVPRSNMLLPFSSKNEKKFSNQGFTLLKKVHSSFIPELSHQGYKISKSTKFSKA